VSGGKPRRDESAAPERRRRAERHRDHLFQQRLDRAARIERQFPFALGATAHDIKRITMQNFDEAARRRRAIDGHGRKVLMQDR